MAVFAYNTTPHSGTLYSPFYLIYGRIPHLPIDVTLENYDTSGYTNYDEYTRGIETTWKLVKESAILNSHVHRENYKKYYHAHTQRMHKYKKHQKVLVELQ